MNVLSLVLILVLGVLGIAELALRILAIPLTMFTIMFQYDQYGFEPYLWRLARKLAEKL